MYDAVINQIKKKYAKVSACCGLEFSDVPHCTTVESMAREFGAISDLQTAETILSKTAPLDLMPPHKRVYILIVMYTYHFRSQLLFSRCG